MRSQIILLSHWSFARRHFDLFNNHFRGENGTRLIVIARPVTKGMLKGAQFVTRYGDQLIETAKFEMPIDWGYTIEVMGCVNGLLLLHKFRSPLQKWESTEMILCNPLIAKALIIPPSPESLQLGRGTRADLGFGYDPWNDDYKVVAAAHSECGGIMSLEFYSVKRGSWKNVNETEALGPDQTLCVSNKLYAEGIILLDRWSH